MSGYSPILICDMTCKKLRGLDQGTGFNMIQLTKKKKQMVGHFRNRLIEGTDSVFFRPKFQGRSPQNIVLYMVLTYLHLLDPEDLPLIGGIMKSPG